MEKITISPTKIPIEAEKHHYLKDNVVVATVYLFKHPLYNFWWELRLSPGTDKQKIIGVKNLKDAEETLRKEFGEITTEKTMTEEEFNLFINGPDL